MHNYVEYHMLDHIITASDCISKYLVTWQNDITPIFSAKLMRNSDIIIFIASAQPKPMDFIMMAADVSALNTHQYVNIHWPRMVRNIACEPVVLYPLSKRCSKEVGTLATRRFICLWGVCSRAMVTLCVILCIIPSINIIALLVAELVTILPTFSILEIDFPLSSTTDFILSPACPKYSARPHVYTCDRKIAWRFPSDWHCLTFIQAW